MLILNRNAGQSILISDDIKIFILSGAGDIRVGIDAPSEMRILRGELLRRHVRLAQHKPQPTIIYSNR